jgi:hypothetical protein
MRSFCDIAPNDVLDAGHDLEAIVRDPLDPKTRRGRMPCR